MTDFFLHVGLAISVLLALVFIAVLTVFVIVLIQDASRLCSEKRTIRLLRKMLAKNKPETTRMSLDILYRQGFRCDHTLSEIEWVLAKHKKIYNIK